MALTNENRLHETHARATRYLDTKLSEIDTQVWAVKVNRGGQAISALQELADTKTYAIDAKAQLQALRADVAGLTATVKGLAGALGAVAQGEKLDVARLLSDIEARTEAGVRNAITAIETVESTTVIVKEPAPQVVEELIPEEGTQQ